ncbi:MAG TPA: diguanylate cyclase [Lacipirellula sp.]
MFVFGALLTRVIIDVSLAFVAFFVGFFTALLYARHTSGGSRKTPPPQPAPVIVNKQAAAQAEAAANEAARAAMAAQQLRDLAANMASDVGAHNELVEGIADQLGALTAGDSNNSVVMEAVAKMLEANKKLAERLEDAETKIQTQAEEIRTQQSEARTDALTKLANRRAFDQFLAECVEQFHKESKPVSLIMLDVDHFKQFNDTHGHPAGDEVLRTVGRTLTRSVKSGDLACRYGGEEFAVVLVNTAAADAQVAADRIRKAIEAMPVHFEGNTLRVTASVGMAECMADEDTAHLIRRADESVYTSKKSGRNCAHWHNGEEFFRINIAKIDDASAQRSAPTLPQMAADVAKLPGRAAFADELKRRIAESHRFGFPLTLLHFRVKDFKKLEHTYGNAIGALLIDSLASFIQSTLRDMDLLGKLENGELIVMLPGSTDSASKIVGQRVKTSISLCPIPLGDHQVRLDLDMGVSTVQPDEDAASAMASARDAMEAAAAAEAAAAHELQHAEAAAVEA